MRLLLAMFLAYFIGAIPTALWLGRRFLGVDIRQHGSGNLGATNAFRVMGAKWGTTVLAIDILKGLAPVVVLPWLLRIDPVSPFQEVLIGLMAIVGHCYSCFVDFRGGKGVATTLGVFLAIATKATLILLVLGIGIIAVTGYVSAASLTGAVLLPPLLYLFGAAPIVMFLGTVISLVVIVRHRGNVERLLRGEENSLWQKRGDPSDDEPIPPVRKPD